MSTHAYGSRPDQVADLWLPDGDVPDTGWPVVVLVHGGFWRHRYRRDLMEPLARDLTARGIAAWNVEYRRVPPPDEILPVEDRGGWPTTLQDVAAAMDALADLDAPLDLHRVATVGHSAGGQLALWLASRARLPVDAPGAAPRLLPTVTVGLAPAADLRGGERVAMGNGAMADLLGGSSAEVPERWDVADPLRHVGHGVPVLLVHGEQDESVPLAQSQAYAEAVTAAGDEVAVTTATGDHMAVIDPGSALWLQAAAWVEQRLT